MRGVQTMATTDDLSLHHQHQCMEPALVLLTAQHSVHAHSSAAIRMWCSDISSGHFKWCNNTWRRDGAGAVYSTVQRTAVAISGGATARGGTISAVGRRCSDVRRPLKRWCNNAWRRGVRTHQGTLQQPQLLVPRRGCRPSRPPPPAAAAGQPPRPHQPHRCCRPVVTQLRCRPCSCSHPSPAHSVNSGLVQQHRPLRSPPSPPCPPSRGSGRQHSPLHPCPRPLPHHP